MDTSVLEKVPYFMDAYYKWLSEYPDMPMLADDKYAEGWTRTRVEELSAKIYNYLKRNGIGKEDFVLICLPRGVLPIIASIGVWKAGAAVVMVEDNYPADRIAFIKQDCGCKATIDLELLEEIANNEEPLAGFERPADTDAAFAVYTSGSTGRPKGVLHEYGNIKLDALVANLQAEPGVQAAVIAPLNFIASLKTVFGIMYAPVTLHVMPYSVVKNPRRIVDYFLSNKINITFLSPSIIRAVGGNFGPYLKIIHTGSEPANDLHIDGVNLVNNYTLSEGGFTVCQFPIDKPYDTCPVGKPNSPIIQVHLLDENDNEVAPGEIGEIAFENPFLRGYINLPEQTAEALRGGLFHTGDLARLDENGNFVLAGRANDMIKIDGNRIEPAEIEAAFKSVTGKSWCAAKGFESPENSFVCAYYLGDLEMDEADIRKRMSKLLPYYMIPTYFMQIPQVPILPNGKFARKELPDPRASLCRKEYVAPSNEFEEQLCKAIGTVLNVEKVGATEDFYELGGSSVTAMKVLAEMDIDTLSAVDIFQGRTAEGIYENYKEKAELEEDISEEEKEMRARKRPHEVSAAQHAMIDRQLYTPHAPVWIFPYLISFGPNADTEKILYAARKTVEHHAIFGTVFELNSYFELQQRYDPESVQEVNLEFMSDAEFEDFRSKRVETFKLLHSPMVKLRVIKTDSNTYVLVVFHHVVMDGSSVQVLLGNFFRAYAGVDMELDTFYSCLEDEERLHSLSSYRRAFNYYRENYGGIDWCGQLEPDKDEPGNINACYKIENELTPAKLAKLEESCGASVNVFINAVALLALARVSGKRDVIASALFHNRDDERKKRACGPIFRSVPMGMRLDKYVTLADFYEGLRQQSADAIANSAYDWVHERQHNFGREVFASVYETADITDQSKLESFGAKLEPIEAHNEGAMRSTLVQCFEHPDDVDVLMWYMANKYSEERIAEYAREFTMLVNKLVEETEPQKVLIEDLLA